MFTEKTRICIPENTKKTLTLRLPKIPKIYRGIPEIYEKRTCLWRRSQHQLQIMNPPITKQRTEILWEKFTFYSPDPRCEDSTDADRLDLATQYYPQLQLCTEGRVSGERIALVWIILRLHRPLLPRILCEAANVEYVLSLCLYTSTKNRPEISPSACRSSRPMAATANGLRRRSSTVVPRWPMAAMASCVDALTNQPM